jgi:hypothetical protein
VQSILFTPVFVKQAERIDLSEDELQEIAVAIATSPKSGDLIRGTGGARKLRHTLRGKGKSGGLRTIHYFGGDDIPVFMLAIYDKSQSSDITQADRNELAKVLPKIAEVYRRRKA